MFKRIIAYNKATYRTKQSDDNLFTPCHRSPVRHGDSYKGDAKANKFEGKEEELTE